MYIEKSLKEALEDYMLGRPVTVLWTGSDGDLNAMRLSDLLGEEENHYLVDVPAVQEMKESVQPAPEEIIQAVHDTQKEPEDCPPEQEQSKKELEEETVDPGDNSDRHLCMTCKYRGKKRPGRPKKGVKPGCDYYVITDHERGCDVEKCDKWEEE
nr:MAG TPA: hypothetical protein [Bacteriophage sp.]